MAYQKLQAGEALAILTSDTINIPNPANQVISGTTTATTADKLVDSGATFSTGGVKVGDIIYNTTDSTIATVTAVDSETTLSVSANIFASGEAYQVYTQSNESPNNGCVLYVGVAGDIKVKMAGGNDVVFKTVAAGSFLPINVIQVFATGTTATDIVALW